MTNYKEINDSAGSQDIVAQSNSFFISSTAGSILITMPSHLCH